MKTPDRKDIDVRIIEQQLQAMAFANAEEPQLSASAMWWRLSMRRRRELASRAAQSLVWMQRIFVVLVVFLYAAVFTICWHAFPSSTWVIGLLCFVCLSVPVGIVLWRLMWR